MRLDENWAVDVDRIRAFFREQADLQEAGGRFHYRSCAISLTPLQAQVMGKWALPRTRLIFEGEDADVQAVHRRFLLRFLSAGG